jgi:AraC-like DNA-binding protein
MQGFGEQVCLRPLEDEIRRNMMTCQIEKLDRFVNLVQQHCPQEGGNLTSITDFATFKASTTQRKSPVIDVSALFVVGQGRKNCYVGNRVYEYNAGNAVMMFYPMAVQTEIVKASPDKPFLAAGIRLDLGRMADVLLRIERVEGPAVNANTPDPSGVLSAPVDDLLLDPMIRILESLASPTDAAMLGDSIVDEIHYRILRGDRGNDLRILLQQRGHIQRISKAVEYIHENLDKPVSVEQLAEVVHMGRTSFYENFKDVMHLSPLQYAKSVKLHKAQTLIKEGKNASEAAYLVGYNSPAQFSREYKRHYGFAPSAT